MPRFVIFDKTENEDKIFILYRCPTDLIRKLQNQAIMQEVPAKKKYEKEGCTRLAIYFYSIFGVMSSFIELSDT